jgi:hypothetical protein
MARNSKAMFDGNPIHMGDFLQIEFDTDLLGWIMVNDVRGPRSVLGTILEQVSARYPQGRSMVMYLQYAREHRSKDNPPPLWTIARAA